MGRDDAVRDTQAARPDGGGLLHFWPAAGYAQPCFLLKLVSTGSSV